MSDSTISKAQASDAKAIAHMVTTAYRGESGKKGWTSEASMLGGSRTDEADIKSILATPDQVMLVKKSSGQEGAEFEACVMLQKRPSDTAYLGMLTTNVERQAKGTGSAMLKAAEEFVVREWNSKRMEMTVISLRTELINWYTKRGYRVTNEKRPYPAETRFGIPLVEGLEFNVLEKDLTT